MTGFRWAVYARYSSDMQRATSIDDQAALCREWIARTGGTVVDIYADFELSGAHAASRPSYQRLIADAALKRYDGVIAEGLDRFARNLADTDRLRALMEFHGIRLATVAEGDVTLMHVGLKGTMNALFLTDLALKIRRGMKGAAERGQCPGGITFGYRVGATAGERVIDPSQATVVIKIFEAIAAGESARVIARRLNAEDAPSPREGGGWRASTITGSRKRGNGILHNECYIGRIVFGRQKRARNPETGRVIMRTVPREQWQSIEKPEWRIVPQELWDAAHRRHGPSTAKPLYRRRRPPRLLSGLIRCGLCRAPMIIRKGELLVCSAARDLGRCDHHETIAAEEVETRVLDAVAKAMNEPEQLSVFIAEYHRERERLRRQETQRRAHVERKLSQAETAISSMIRAVERGLYDEAMKPRLAQLQAERDAARAELARMGEMKVIHINPQAAEVYKRKLADLRQAVREEGPHAARARDQIRALAPLVEVYPEKAAGRRRIEVGGDLGVIIAVANNQAVDVIDGSGGGS